MQATREQALQAMKSFNLDISAPELSMVEAIKAVTIARQLESTQRRHVFTEVATHAWLRHRPFGSLVYPEFENVLWEYLLKHEKVEEKAIAFLSDNRTDKEVETLYINYLKGMFAASGKTRLEFYEEMLVEAGIKIDLEHAEFGNEAVNFFLRVANSVHKEHLLVYYLTGLFFKAYENQFSSQNTLRPSEDVTVGIAFGYFEKEMPFSPTFVSLSMNISTIEGALPNLFFQLHVPKSFFSVKFENYIGLRDYFLGYIFRCTKVFEREASERDSSDAWPKATGREQPLLGIENTVHESPSHEAGCHYQAAALCQSTGVGKSRLVSSLGDVPNILLLHICLRAVGQEGEPERTPYLADAILACHSPCEMLRILAGSLYAALYPEGKEESTGEDLQVTYPVPKDSNSDSTRNFWRHAYNIAKGEAYANLDEIKMAVICKDLAKKLLESRANLIVFAMDEAAILCKTEDAEGHTKLQDFLDALAAFSTGVFGLLLDTSSKVRDFHPGKSRSLMAMARRGMKKLFSPHICLWTFGILKLPTELEGVIKRTPPYILTKGAAWFFSNPFARTFDARPFFGALVIAILKAATAMPIEDYTSFFSRILSLCRSRLNTRPVMVMDKFGVRRLIMAEELCLTLLATRLTILSLQRAGFERCVLSNMATLIAISKDANVISAKFVVEPLLAIAALMEMGERGCLDLLLGTLANMVVSGGVANIFATGDAGEFVASAIFLFAYDWALSRTIAASPETTYLGMPVSVGAYLEALLGSDAVATVAEGCALLNAFTCVLQIVAIDEKVSREGLLQAFTHGVAMVCCRGQRAVDIVIPVAMGRVGADIRMEDLVVGNMTAIFIQVKNWRGAAPGPKAINEIFEAIDILGESLLPNAEYVAVLASVGPKPVSGGGSITRSQNGKGLRIIISGIGSSQFPFFSADAVSSIEVILARGSSGSDEALEAAVDTSCGGDRDTVHAANRLVQRVSLTIHTTPPIAAASPGPQAQPAASIDNTYSCASISECSSVFLAADLKEDEPAAKEARLGSP